MLRTVGIFGGTFDPVHYGHLRVALELKQALVLDEMRMLPNATPPHRDRPSASVEQRLDMLRLALSGQHDLQIDEREINRKGPSYMVDTLSSFRQELGADCSICLVVGSDSFQSLGSWHRWQELFDLAHIVIACRPGWQQDKSSEVGQLVRQRFIDDPVKLKTSPGGYILPQLVTQLAISATSIRQSILDGRSPRYLLPDSVLDFIEKHRIYSRQ